MRLYKIWKRKLARNADNMRLYQEEYIREYIKYSKYSALYNTW